MNLKNKIFYVVYFNEFCSSCYNTTVTKLCPRAILDNGIFDIFILSIQYLTIFNYKMGFKSSFLFILILFLSISACRNPQNESERAALFAENNRLIKELANEKTHSEALIKSIDSLESINTSLVQARDTLQLKMKKQADADALRQKAANKPLELAVFTVVNEAANGSVLKAKAPFKKSDIRYLSFRGTAVNNAAKNKQILRGQLYAIYRLGGLVQRMDNSSGTFTGSDNKKYVFTHSWELTSDKESLGLDKGIGDKTRGIFEKGNWTLELWFEPKGKGVAMKMSEAKFEIN
jgi:hypothetical protein